MKVLVDENLPPALARALAALFVGEHRIVHLRDRFGPGVLDAEWISALSMEGRWIVISGDRNISKLKSEKRAFSSSRLVGFFMSPGLNKAPVVKKMERLMALWSVIETQSEIVQGGAMFELPMKSSKLGVIR